MADNIDMHNWDIATGITYEDANAAIAAAGSSPTSLKFTASDNSASMDVTCGTWSLALGGAGSDIHVLVPLTGGTVTIGTDTHTVTSAQTIFTVYAQYIPHSPSGAGANLRDLVLSSTADGGEVEAEASNPTPPQSNGVVQAVLLELLNQWVVANLNEFNHVFAVVDLEADFSTTPALSWMKPWYLGYACSEPSSNPSLANSVFGVLALVDEPSSEAEKNKLIANLAYDIDLGVIPEDKKAGLAVAARKFLQHMILPATPYMFGDVGHEPPISSFTIDNDGNRIITNAALTMAPLHLDNGKTIEPTVPAGQFYIEVDGRELKVSAQQMTFSGGPGITVKLNYDNAMSLGLSADGTTLDLSMVRQSAGGDVETSKVLDVLQIALGVVSIVTAIVSAGGGALVKAANAAVESANAAAIAAAESSGEEVAAADEIAVTAARGMIKGTVESVSTLSGRIATVVKVAVATAFVSGTTVGIIEILRGIAGGDAKAKPDIREFTETAMDKVVKFTSTHDYELSEAYLQGALIFGLDHAKS
ncbi:TULIP family P47-like protein [Desertibaculum subflavum]|uniref:TULIP family P47-like protein n=1 Tax=Desertibaculum subflavum TaxID=2268458 RepID=UPI000E663409